jgi:hypothetical protein
MLLSVGIDGLDTSRLIPGCDLIQTIKEGKNLFRIYPGSSEFVWHLVLALEFFDEPIGEQVVFPGPGGKVEDDRYGVIFLSPGTIEQLTG